VVTGCTLLGFTRGMCTRGPQQGLILVRSLWRADVRLESWNPRFEMTHRRLAAAGEAPRAVTIAEAAMGPIYRRMFAQAIALADCGGPPDQ
jgi:hypothetical protein